MPAEKNQSPWNSGLSALKHSFNHKKIISILSGYVESLLIPALIATLIIGTIYTLEREHPSKDNKHAEITNTIDSLPATSMEIPSTIEIIISLTIITILFAIAIPLQIGRAHISLCALDRVYASNRSLFYGYSFASAYIKFILISPFIALYNFRKLKITDILSSPSPLSIIIFPLNTLIPSGFILFTLSLTPYILVDRNISLHKAMILSGDIIRKNKKTFVHYFIFSWLVILISLIFFGMLGALFYLLFVSTLFENYKEVFIGISTTLAFTMHYATVSFVSDILLAQLYRSHFPCTNSRTQQNMPRIPAEQ